MSNLNTTLNSGTGGNTVIGENVGGNVMPVSKIRTGADGTDDGDVAIDNAFPVGGPELGGFVPDPSAIYTGAVVSPKVDAEGQQAIRGPVITDEQSFRTDFLALSTALTGTISVTNGSTAVTGSGTAFTSEIRWGDYVKVTAHSETAYALVDSVESDTALTLASGYTGATALGVAGVVAEFATSTPSGGTIAVSSSILNITAPTTNGAITAVRRAGDYPPYVLTVYASVSQRIANQEIAIGFTSSVTSPVSLAQIVFSGTNNSQVTLRTASETGTLEETTVTLPDGKTTAQSILYEIDLGPKRCALTIDRSQKALATHYVHIPRPYDEQEIAAYIRNTGAAGSATTLAVDAIYFQNVNEINVQRIGSGDPMPVQVMQPPDTGDTTQGHIALSAANTTAAVRATTYTEQSAAFTGSILSASANDTAAGTGVRSVIITYYDASYAGPFTETASLNGTTPVSLSASKKYIESVRAVTTGTGGVAAGLITLRNDAAAAVWTIAAGDAQTYGAHHYVPINKTCSIRAISHGSSATALNQGSRAHLRSVRLNVSNAALLQITSDLNSSAGAQATRVFDDISCPKVVGPARIDAWVTTLNAASITYSADFSWSERG